MKSKLRLTLLTDGGEKTHEGHVDSRSLAFSVWESLACGYLKRYTEDLIHPDDYFFADGYFETDEEIIAGASECDIVGFSGTTSQMPWSLRIAAAIRARNPSCRIFVGGYGPSVSPEAFLKDEVAVPRGPIQGAVVGEGERSWRSIVLSGGVQSGIVYEPPIPDLDSIPFPDRDFIKMERCAAIAKREEGRKVTSIWGNRGCLRRCKFCADGSPKTIYGAPLRERSPLDILAEMRVVHRKYDIEFFKFADAEVNTRPGRIKQLCETFIQHGWDVPWGGNMLVNPMDETDAKMLYAAGCREVWMGLESGSPEVLAHIGKGTNLATIRKAFKITKDAGLLRRSYVLLGTPLESRETIRQTEELIEEVQPDTVSFSILCPYPGTTYYTDEMRGWDWEHADEYGGEANKWRTNFLSHADLVDEQIRLIEKFSGKLSRIIKKKQQLGVIPTSISAPLGIINTNEISLTDRCN